MQDYCLQNFKKPYILKFTNKNKVRNVVIFDRDGVVNKKPKAHSHIKNTREVHVLNPFLKLFSGLNKYSNKTAFVLFTNQRWILQNPSNIRLFESISKYINNVIINHTGTGFDSVYCCNHAIDDIRCNCRKPKPGLLWHILKDYDTTPFNCLVVGDTDSDIKTAQNAGVNNFFKISTNHPLSSEKYIKDFFTSASK